MLILTLPNFSNTVLTSSTTSPKTLDLFLDTRYTKVYTLVYEYAHNFKYQN